MKSLHLDDLKKNEAVPDSYEIAVAYKGRKVEIMPIHYSSYWKRLIIYWSVCRHWTRRLKSISHMRI